MVSSMTRTERPSEFLYKATLRKQYGLTPSMIDELGEPDEYVDNPHYASGPMASLYRIDRVLGYLNQNRDRVERAKESRPKRSAAAQKVQERKRAERLRQEEEERTAEERQFAEWRRQASEWLDRQPITCQTPFSPTLIEDAQKEFGFKAGRPYWEQAGLRSYVRYNLTNFRELLKMARRYEWYPVIHDMLRQRVDQVVTKAILEWRPLVEEAV
jgi:hypothetical protein